MLPRKLRCLIYEEDKLCSWLLLIIFNHFIRQDKMLVFICKVNNMIYVVSQFWFYIFIYQESEINSKCIHLNNHLNEQQNFLAFETFEIKTWATINQSIWQFEKARKVGLRLTRRHRQTFWYISTIIFFLRQLQVKII